jgi:hypothetical protein
MKRSCGRGPLLSILGLAACLLAAGCGKDAITAVQGQQPVESAQIEQPAGPVQVQQPGGVETPPAEVPGGAKIAKSFKTAGQASTPQGGGSQFDKELALVRDAREPHVLFALERLSRLDQNPELKTARADPARRTTMAGAILHLFNNGSSNIVGSAAGALPAWVGPDELPTVVALLDKTKVPHKQLLRALGEIQDPRCAPVLGSWFLKEGRPVSAAFQKLGPELCEKEVLKFLHHPDRNAHAEARKILEAFKTSDDALVDQTLLDLKAAEAKRRFAAAGWVEQRDTQAPRRTELAKAVEPLVTEREAEVFKPAIKALRKLGSADNIPAMDAFLKSGIPYDKRDLYVFLGQTKDVRAATVLVRELGSRERGVARDALKACGAAAEDPVRKLLQSDQRQDRLDAVSVLQVIGTKASIPDLEKAKTDKDRSVQDGAKKALKLIAER